MASCETSLLHVFLELIDGAPASGAYVLNPGDRGLLHALDGLSAAEASLVPDGSTASVAAHVDHVRYGLSLLNRWSEGHPDIADADFTASWKRNQVTADEWDTLRAAFRNEVQAWRQVLARPAGNWNEVEHHGVVASVVHLAYHVGAMRQLQRSLRGPNAWEANEVGSNPQPQG